MAEAAAEPGSGQAVRVECAPCGNRWEALRLPMPAREACRLMLALRCPQCGAGADRLRFADGA